MSTPRGRLLFVLLVAAVAGAVLWFVTRSGSSSSSSRAAESAPNSSQAGQRPTLGGSAGGEGDGDAGIAAGQTRLCTQPSGNAALVDGAPITLERLCRWLARTGAVRDGKVEARQARMVLDQMIDALLISRAAEKAGAVVTEAELRAELDKLGAGSAVDAELLKEQLRQRLEARKLVDSRGTTVVTDAEVDAELARGAPGIDRGQGIRVEAWVRRLAQGADAAAEAAAEQAAHGFAAAVPKESPEAAAGRHGLRRLAPFVVGTSGLEPELEEMVQAMSPGQWSRAVRTRVGWSVVRVIERVEGTKLDDKQLRARVRQALENRKRNVGRDDTLARLRAEARIEILIER